MGQAGTTICCHLPGLRQTQRDTGSLILVNIGMQQLAFDRCIVMLLVLQCVQYAIDKVRLQSINSPTNEQH